MNEEEKYINDIKALVLYNEYQQNLSNAATEKESSEKALTEYLAKNPEPTLESNSRRLLIDTFVVAVCYGVYRLGAWIFGSSVIWMAICAILALFLIYCKHCESPEEAFKKRTEKYQSEKTALEEAKNNAIEKYDQLQSNVEAMKSYIDRESSIPLAYQDKAEILAYYYFYKGIRNMDLARQELNHEEMMGLLQQTREDAEKQNNEIREQLNKIQNDMKALDDNIIDTYNAVHRINTEMNLN